MNRSCPSCRKRWPAEGLVCPECLVDLVDDPDATVTCHHCGRECPASMVSCPGCLAELRPDPEAVAEAIDDILLAGGHLFRPDHLPPFRDGPSCTLQRLSGHGSLVFVGADGLVEATVQGPGVLAVPPLVCRDVDGSVLFRLLRYEAAERAVVAFGSDGAPLATYLRTDGGLDVRDEASAPVGLLRRATDGYRLVETGGGVLATCERSDAEQDGYVDDQWWLRPDVALDDLPFRPLAAVALLLATKVLLGRAWPDKAPEQPAEEDGWSPLL